MHLPSFLFVSLFLSLISSTANALGNGRLLVSAPDNAVSCQPAVVQWVWTGTAEDAMTNSLSVAVVPEDGYFRRHVFDKRSTQLIKRRTKAQQKRDVAINIAGGSQVPMASQTWTWTSVGVTPGRYRIALTVLGADYTSYSAIFSVTAGDDQSCLGISGGLSASSTSLPDASTTAISTSAQLATSSTITSSASITSAVSGAAASADTSTPISANAAHGDSDSDSDNSHHGGKIAAAVLVPLIAISLVFLYFFFKRKRSINDASAKRKEWSEKAMNMLNGGHHGSSHARNISEPTNPVHAGGLAQHAEEIRAEMQEARNMPDMSARVMSPTGTEHWVDFAGETDACPVTPNDMIEILRASMDKQRSSASDVQNSPVKSGGLYQQGQNVALRESMSSLEGSTTTSSAASSLPAYLREVRSPAPSFGQDADGRPLVAGAAAAASRPSIDTVSQTSTVTHELSRNGSIASTATIAAYGKTTNGSRDLTRNNSRSGSIRRKPVPRESFRQAVESNEHGPFADSQAGEAMASTEAATTTSAIASDSQPPATKSLPHFSVQSGPVIGDDQLQEILDAESVAARTPRQSHYADAPMSVYDSPAVASQRGSTLTGGRFPGRSLFGPMDVGTSETGSPFPDSQSDAWKLSVRLSDQDRGFRVSFPVDDQQL